MVNQGGKSTFKHTEKIQYKLDSTLLSKEGEGMYHSKMVYYAYAIIAFD